MKTVTLFWAVILLVAFSTATFGQDKYVPKPNEELYGTWTNASMNLQKTVVFSGAYKDYRLIKDTTPVAEDKEEIVAKWTDSDGNIWYKTIADTASGSWAGYKVLVLHRISKSATVKESVMRRLLGDYNPKMEVLLEIDPSDYTYTIYYRAQK